MDKSKITKRFVYAVTSLTVLIFIIIFTVITFAIRYQNEASDETDINHNTEPNNYNSDVKEESSSELSTSIFDTTSEDISDIIAEDFSVVSSIEEDIVEDFEHGWIINEFGYTYVYNGCGYEQFNYKTSALNRYANALNGFVDLLPESTKIFSITVPVSSTFANIPKEIYVEDNFYNQAQSTFVSTLSTLTNQRITHVTIVDVLESSYDNGDYVYYRTDKNWTANGAYLAYTKFCESADISALPIGSFLKNTSHGYLGSFYNATKLENMKNAADEFIYYLPNHSVKSSLTVYDNGLIYNNYSVCGNKINPYSPQNVFLGRDAERYEINTINDGESLLIVGDESVYPIIPFLMSHYKHIDIINPYKFETPFEEFLKNRSYDQCLLMCYSTNSVSGDYIPTLNSLTGVFKDE